MSKQQKVTVQEKSGIEKVIAIIIRWVLSSFLLALSVVFFIFAVTDICGFAFPEHHKALVHFATQLWHHQAYLLVYLTFGFMLIIIAAGLLGKNNQLFSLKRNCESAA